MKVFFSGSIRGGRELLPVYQYICSIITSNGYEVISNHVVDPQLEKVESSMNEREIFERDMLLLDQSSCLIAEVSIPSTGVGYEICTAVYRGIPILCLYMSGSQVSSMILGNPYILHQVYFKQEELETTVLTFLASVHTKYRDNI
ncbi:MAG: nucleoside 2-deoxyribosyltransferase [Methanomethylovorans sp.]|jgi:hypothetical protein|nr:nucleoside 2-deoxyribosyltransferase [Methanomethylovorans sp.]